MAALVMLPAFARFRTRHQPYMVRNAYRHELRSAATFPLASSLAEGAFTGVVAAKYFNASPLLIAVITAAPMFGNIMALLWADLAEGRRKVPFVNRLQAGVVLCVALAAATSLVPSRTAGGWVFAALIIAARMLASGIVTIRSAIWRVNYPRQTRGQIISRIAVVATAVQAAATWAGSYWLDWSPRSFSFLYLGSAVLGAIGIAQFAKIRVRREAQSLRRQRAQLYAPRPENSAQTDESNVMNYNPPDRSGWRGPVGLWRFFLNAFRDAADLLRRDPAFREYQWWQFLAGVSFMMFTPSLLVMVSKEMTNPQTEYRMATFVLQIVPMVTVLVATQMWAPLFDRVHISVFRVYQTSVSVSAQLALFAGAMYGMHVNERTGLVLIGLAQVLNGITNAGGNLAWNLGHNDFAPADRAADYMAVHVMLTGVRGCVAPFLGVWLYEVPWVGRRIFLLSAVVCCVALVGFVRMARRRPRGPLDKPGPNRPRTERVPAKVG